MLLLLLLLLRLVSRVMVEHKYSAPDSVQEKYPEYLVAPSLSATLAPGTSASFTCVFPGGMKSTLNMMGKCVLGSVVFVVVVVVAMLLLLLLLL